MRIKSYACLLGAALLLATASSAAAQEFRATVRGQILDSSKGALPGATVSMTNTEWNHNRNPESTVGRHEARDRRHPRVGRRSRQALLWRPGMAARRRLRRRRRLSGDPVHAPGLRGLGHLRQERHRGGSGLRPRTVPYRVRIEGARNDLLRRGVEVSDVFHGGDNVYAGTDEPYLFGRVRVGGPDPDHGSYRSFASFSDPDGNGWLFQEVTTRLPGRIDSNATSFASAGSEKRDVARGARTRRA